MAHSHTCTALLRIAGVSVSAAHAAETMSPLCLACPATSDASPQNTPPAEHGASQAHSKSQAHRGTSNTQPAQWMCDTFNVSARELRDVGALSLCTACERGDLALARWLSESCALTPTDARADDNNALSLACVGGHLEVARWLTAEFGLTADDIRGVDHDNFALRECCSKGLLDVVRWLVDADSGLGLTNADVRSYRDYCLYAASASGSLELVRFITERFIACAGDGSAALRDGCTELLQMGLRRNEFDGTGSDESRRGFTRSHSDIAEHAVHEACVRGHLEIAKYLERMLTVHADRASAQHADIRTAHDTAATCDHSCDSDRIETDSGHARKNTHASSASASAPRDHSDARSQPALQAAVQAADHSACSLLHTVTLWRVCRAGHLSVLEWMFDALALTTTDVRARENLALRLACKNGHLAVAQLLHRKARLTAIDARSGETSALCEAQAEGHADVAKWLVSEIALSELEPTRRPPPCQN